MSETVPAEMVRAARDAYARHTGQVMFSQREGAEVARMLRVVLAAALDAHAPAAEHEVGEMLEAVAEPAREAFWRMLGAVLVLASLPGTVILAGVAVIVWRAAL